MPIEWDLVRNGADQLSAFFKQEQIGLYTAYNGRKFVDGEWIKTLDGWMHDENSARTWREFAPVNYSCTSEELHRTLEAVIRAEHCNWMSDRNKEYGNIYPQFDRADEPTPIPARAPGTLSPDDPGDVGNANHHDRFPYNAQRQGERNQIALDLAAAAGIPFGQIRTRIFNAYDAHFGSSPRNARAGT